MSRRQIEFAPPIISQGRSEAIIDAYKKLGSCERDVAPMSPSVQSRSMQIDHGNTLTGAPAARFDVVADLCPSLMCRALGLIAQHDIVPSHVMMEALSDRILLSFWVVGLSDSQAQTIVRKIQSIVSVQNAILS